MNLREKILAFGNYPEAEIEEMIKSRYSLVMIGNSHEVPYIDEERNTLLRLAKAIRKKKIIIAHEILPPIQLQYIKDFLQDENEYNTLGTIHSAIPDSDLVQMLRSYRSKLARNHAESMALWYLDQGFEVICPEHGSALEWSRESDYDLKLKRVIEEEVGDNWINPALILRCYKDLRRDIHNLKQINKYKPDVICYGNAHVEVYGNLLDLPSSNMFFIPEGKPSFLEQCWNEFSRAQRIFRSMNS
jgi:hypothetical protein